MVSQIFSRSFRLKNDKNFLDPDPPVEVPKWKPGCPKPYIEDMNYNVIDKFYRHGKFGYVFELTTPVKFDKAGFQASNVCFRI